MKATLWSDPPERPLSSVASPSDFWYLKFFGFKFWYILPLTVTGLSPVLLHKMLELSYQANLSQFGLSLTNHEKSFGSTHFWEIFKWALAHSTFTMSDRRHHMPYVAHSGTLKGYYSIFTSESFGVVRGTAVYQFTAQRWHTVYNKLQMMLSPEALCNSSDTDSKYY